MRSQRCLRRWLQDQWRADSQRRRQLVRHQIEREIKRRNPGYRSTRHPPKQGESAFGARQLIRRQHFTTEHARFGRTESKRRNAACHFGFRVADWLAALARDQKCELVALGLDRKRELLEDQRSLVGRAPRPRLERGSGAADRGLQIVLTREPDFADDAGVERVSNRLGRLRVLAFAAEVRADRARRHGRWSISRDFAYIAHSREKFPNSEQSQCG